MGKRPRVARVTELDWAVVKKDFEPDGSLRDIYVLAATVEDWSSVLEFVQRGPYKAELTRDGHPTHEGVQQLFANEGRPLAQLLFKVAGVTLVCHFFTKDEIEFDFVPDTVGEPGLRALLDFMADIGDLTGKTVVMTPENLQEAPIFRYSPADRRLEGSIHLS